MRTRFAAVVVVATLLLALPPLAVVAQDGSPVPESPAIESPAPDLAAVLAESVFADTFPADLGGMPWDFVDVQAGQEIVEGQEEEDVAQTQALLERLGATIEDLATASAYQSTESAGFRFIAAYRVAGVEADRLLEELLPLMLEDIEQPRQESGQVAGKDVLYLWDDSFVGEDGEEPDPFVIYVAGDTLWLVSAAEPDLTEAFERLP